MTKTPPRPPTGGGGNTDELARIISALKTTPRGMTVTQVAEAIGMNRISAARYLDVLRVSGQVDMTPFGQAKVFTIAHRVPVQMILNFTSDGIAVVDRTHRIIQANNNFLSLVDADIDDAVGEQIEQILSPLEPGDGTPEALYGSVETAFTGRAVIKEIAVTKDKTEMFFKMRIIPTAFADGSSAATIILEDITDYRRTLAECTTQAAQFDKVKQWHEANAQKISEFVATADTFVETATALTERVDAECWATPAQFKAAINEIRNLTRTLKTKSRAIQLPQAQPSG